jgi:hypothetical protein
MFLLRLAGINMSDEASETVAGGVKNYLGAIGFILPLLGGEELIRLLLTGSGLPWWGSALLIVAGLPVYLSPAAWKRLKGQGQKPMATAIIVASALGLMFGIYLLARPSAPGTEITQAGASPAPAPQGGLAARASLQLLMRPNQDPQELSRDNVWRWFAFKILGQDPTGTRVPIATFIYLTFDRPVQTNYRRVFSQSNPNLHFDILDLTERSMIIGIQNVDPTGATIEVQVSGAPL